ncbi:IAA-alanine resistance protein 1-like [Mangifera indica]|uniref:IAA-alanine resistance protein 1-like n=1 Tax=Mangifera indica TaxID=29780 RepID=UPI001CF99F54|nr:IAA-alanine resistance protein 1-like [Mangifera indica]
MLLPEELAEEEDLRLYEFGPHYHDHHVGDSPQGNLGWSYVGDAFCHQLPHAFEFPFVKISYHCHIKEASCPAPHGSCFFQYLFICQLWPESTPDHEDHAHHHSSSHSLKDLFVGISVLAGIVLFLLVGELVRYVDENSGDADSWGDGHHHRYHNSKKLRDDDDVREKKQSQAFHHRKIPLMLGMIYVRKRIWLHKEHIPCKSVLAKRQKKREIIWPSHQHKHFGQNRKTSSNAGDDKADVDAIDGLSDDVKSLEQNRSSNLVFGYLNLFSDGHNFTDGMALVSAFLLYGSVGGWSRTLFLFAHELPQEVGNFGILVRSGFSVSKALFFFFLSALVALAVTAMALLWGQDPGQSSLIEGFAADGFIYIAVAGVLAEMDNNGNSALRSTAVQLTSLIFGMSVALCISLVE